MRILLAAAFIVIAVPLIVSALGTLAATKSITDQTLPMIKNIADLMCFSIAVVAA